MLIAFADFDTSSYIARHTKEQVSLILGIHDGGDGDRVMQVPFPSIDYSREGLGARMLISIE